MKKQTAGKTKGFQKLSSLVLAFAIAITTFFALAEPAVAKTSQNEETRIIIAEGFTRKLSVKNGTVKSWSSGNEKIATVDSTGKLTAKKKGKATISAKLNDGRTLKYKVTVVENVYKAKKISLKDVAKGKVAFEIYKIFGDKKGNLVMKAKCVSRLSQKLPEFSNLKIELKDNKGNTVGTYKKDSLKMNLTPDSSKEFTLVLKKSGLEMEKVQLPFIKYEISASVSQEWQLL